MTAHWNHSIRLRLTVWFSLVFLIVFIALSGLLYWSVHHELQRLTTEELVTKSDMFRHLYVEAAARGETSEIRHRFDDALVGHRELRVWLLNDNRSRLYGTSDIPVFVRKATAPVYGTVLRVEGLHMLGMRSQLEKTHAVEATEMILAMDVGPQERLLTRFRFALLGICILGVIGTAFLGNLTAWYSLRPLGRISSQAQALTGHTLSTRLSMHGVDKEVRALIIAFNQSLDRIEQAYRRMETFNADVAHELRTPLATLIGSTQIALSNERPASELAQCLSENLDDLERLKNLINDMLFLARADQGDHASELMMVQLSEEIHQVVEYFDATLEEAKVAVRVTGRARVLCNAALLKRTLINLLSNAVKHTGPGHTIVIAVSAQADAVRVEVRNPGSPVDALALERMFDRFFRADASRAAGPHGYGLGLAIVKAIVLMHGGTVFASSGMDTVVGFTLPLSPTRRE